jgi:hypothetical protein
MEMAARWDPVRRVVWAVRLEEDGDILKQEQALIKVFTFTRA